MDLELFDLAIQYARAADRRDADAYVGLFQPEGTIRVTPTWDHDEVIKTIRGHDELRATIAHAKEHFNRTVHILGQASHERDGDEANGEVYCTANHLLIDGDRVENLVWHLRYQDRCVRDDAGRWRFADRLIHIDWTETRPANHPGDQLPTTSILVPDRPASRGLAAANTNSGSLDASPSKGARRPMRNGADPYPVVAHPSDVTDLARIWRSL